MAIFKEPMLTGGVPVNELVVIGGMSGVGRSQLNTTRQRFVHFLKARGTYINMPQMHFAPAVSIEDYDDAANDLYEWIKSNRLVLKAVIDELDREEKAGTVE